MTVLGVHAVLCLKVAGACMSVGCDTLEVHSKSFRRAREDDVQVVQR